MACLASDGEEFAVGTPFSDHPAGRCATVPVIIGAREVNWQKGSTWFEQQDAATQKKMMGAKYYDAWKAGEFKLGDLRSTVHSDVWGDSPQVTPLNKLLGGGRGGGFGAKRAGRIGEVVKSDAWRGANASIITDDARMLSDKYGIEIDRLVLSNLEDNGKYSWSTGTLEVGAPSDEKELENALRKRLEVARADLVSERRLNAKSRWLPDMESDVEMLQKRMENLGRWTDTRPVYMGDVNRSLGLSREQVTLRHELGHALDKQEQIGLHIFDTVGGESGAVEKWLSQYAPSERATASAQECVAEAFVLISSGQGARLSPELWKIIKGFFGG